MDTDLSDPLASCNMTASQGSTLNDRALHSLRNEIKKILIPTLIKAFQLKSELAQTKSQASSKLPLDQLRSLDQDLAVLSQWCAHCRTLITTAMDIDPRTLKHKVSPHSPTSADLVIQHSFLSVMRPSSPHKRPASSLIPDTHVLSSHRKKPHFWWRFWKNRTKK